MLIRKAFKYRIYPNSTQQQALAVQFGHARYVYNWGLGQSQERYGGYTALTKALTELKRQKETIWLRQAHSQILQQSLKNLDKAWRNYFEKRGKYPRFKSKNARQSVRYPQPKENWLGEKCIRLPKVGYVKIVLHRPIEGTLKSITVSKSKSGKYYVSLQCEIEIEEPQRSGGCVGIDLGLTDYVTLSTGEKVKPPQSYRKALKRRNRLNKQLSRKKKGSANRNKARQRLARLDERISNQRKDFQHKLSRGLIDENQVVGLEDLNVAGMLKNHSLAMSIQDASWSEFVRQLAYKGDWYGCDIVVVDRFFPSTKLCSACGVGNGALQLGDRRWCCTNCGSRHDRDVNAAINILHQATGGAPGSNACGHHVSPLTVPVAAAVEEPGSQPAFSGW